MKFSKFNVILRDKRYEQPILFNTLSGSTFFVDEQTAEAVEAHNTSVIDETGLEYLSRAGVIIDDDMNEDNIYKYNRDSVKYDNTFFSTTVFLTWACNLRCVYCFQDHEANAQYMSLERAEDYITFVKEGALEKGVKNIAVTLFGGEPLLNIHVGYYILEELYNFCIDKAIGFSSSIITNGTLITEKIVSKLCEYKCDSIQVTLDGTKEVHDARRIKVDGKGSFDETIEALKYLNGVRKTGTIIRINVDKTNLANTYSLLDYIGKNGINLTRCYVDFGIVTSNTSACANYAGNCLVESEIGDVLYDLWNYSQEQGFRYNIKPARNFIYCGLYKENCYTIAPNGDVYKCWEQVGDTRHCIGHIDSNGRLADITSVYYDWMTVDPLKNIDCKTCEYLPTCGGGCGVNSYNDTGTYQTKGCLGEKEKINKKLIMFIDKTIESQKKLEQELTGEQKN